ncbi:transposase [Streptomyces sp. DSM 41972]|uniref:Transposase n=1 Tax=Streptomyces althioticus subsp. attaecolombicae TaxID=3075534 RepID=A0ABU3I467_9ACTN|nr:transposase [Streptomyces sp. DSM 41972]SCD60714.1 transposase [Streptomyces sp. di50b]SCD60939.1 transposase [Streptomyces sp. di188]
MAAPRRYSDELRERAARLAVGARKDPAGGAGAIKWITDRLDVRPEALRGWVKRAETGDGVRPGTAGQEAARIAELERGVKELRRANAILKSASAFFAAELDRPPR